MIITLLRITQNDIINYYQIILKTKMKIKINFVKWIKKKILSFMKKKFNLNNIKL